jgi:hypothetical protein
VKPGKNKREQFWNNFLAWTAHYHAPTVFPYDEPGVVWKLEDRCLIRATPDWERWLDAMLVKPYSLFWPCGLGSKRHDPLNLGIVTAVRGVEEAVIRRALQGILHAPPGMPKLIEWDWDKWNKAGGLGPAILHGREWVEQRLPWFRRKPKRKIDSYRVAEWLERAGIKVKRI